jgi:hypothetical protein
MKQENNTFKKKFNLILIGSMTLLVVLGLIIIFTIFSIQRNVENTQRVSETSAQMALCQSAVRGFLLNAWSDTIFVKTGTNPEYEKFQAEVDKLNNNLQFLKENSSGKEIEFIDTTEKSSILLRDNFKRIAELIKERGFKNLGLEGKLREAVHKLENSDLLPDKTAVLTLRKHEKDFFLRRDIKYLESFEQDAPKLENKINALAESPEKYKLLECYQSYLSTFQTIVKVETEIGLNRSSGLRGNINHLIVTSIENLDHLNETFDKTTQNLIKATVSFISVIFLVIIAIVLVGLNKLIKPVFAPMQEIQLKATAISEGNLSVNFDDLKGNTVLKELIEGFEKIIYKFKTTMMQVEGISARQILTEVSIHSEKDEVGTTLNKIITQIKTIDEEEKRRTWHNEGLAKFATILRINDSDEASMYDNIICELVKYMNANQGALFIIEGDEAKDPHLAMKGCYAYDRKKFLNMRIEYAEGLTGMCWAEGQSIFLTDIPENYIRITSGIGGATPNAVIIVPIKFNDKVQGIIELASFSTFQDYQIKYMETLAESIGSAIHNIKTNVRTLALLQGSQEMTEELRAQEEEMRQNMEELQATQEEMERMSVNMRKEMEELRSENETFKIQLQKSDNK